MNRLIDKKEAAALLGVSPLSMNRLMPEIGFVRVGKRRVMFSIQAIKDYCEARTVAPSWDWGGIGGKMVLNLKNLWHCSTSFHPMHKADLEASGLDLEYARQAGAFTLPPGDVGKVLGACGWAWATPQVDTILVFLYPETDYWRCKPFPPLKNRKGQEVKYLQPKGSGNHLFIPPGVDPEAAAPVWLTEGEKKALKLTQEGFPCFGLGGVWGWRIGAKGYRQGGAQTIPCFGKVNWIDREVTMVFDSDAAINPLVALAERGLARELTGRGAKVFLCRIPPK